MTASMESHCISFRDLPHTTKLFTTFVEDFPRVAKYFGHPQTAAGVAAAAREIQLDPAVRRGVVEVLREQNGFFGAGGALDPATSRNLDRLAAGAVAIVTGQQVALFSGPAFSLYKAISTVCWADHITRSGLDAVPIFWLATGDHDLAEVNHSLWNTRDGIARYEIPPSEADAGRRVGEVKLGAAVRDLVAKAADSLEGPGAPEVARALREAYAPEETYGSAFGKLMARLLAGRGIIFVDPLDVRLQRFAAGVYRRALDEAAPLRDALTARSKELERAGFHAQVKVSSASTLLFYNVNGQRLPLRSRNGGFAAGKASFTPEQLRAAIDKTPEAFTPNVLLRPVVQDTLFPTAAYVSGPAETAYFAQTQVIYKQLLGRMPAILSRASFTLVDPLAARLLKKFDLDVRGVFGGSQTLRAKVERVALPRGLSRRFEDDEKKLRKLLKAYRKPLERLDRTLLGALDLSERKMLHQFAKLREKSGRAENLRTGVLDRYTRLLLDSLYPLHGLQERALCLLPTLAAYGPELLDELARFYCSGAPSGCAGQHHVVFL